MLHMASDTGSLDKAAALDHSGIYVATLWASRHGLVCCVAVYVVGKGTGVRVHSAVVGEGAG